MDGALRHDQKLKSQMGQTFYYSDLSIAQFDNQMQDFEAQAGEVFHPSPHMESALATPWKSNDHVRGESSPSSSKNMSTMYQKPAGYLPTGGMVAASDSTWLVDDSTLRYMIPCEPAKVRPGQGLSLSLCTDKPSQIGIQSFELRQPSHAANVSAGFRDGYLAKANWNLHPRQEVLQEVRSSVRLRGSKFMAPTQELLNEFCSLELVGTEKSMKNQESNQREEAVSLSNCQNLRSMGLLELPKRKMELISMLDEVHRRYSQYCDHMRLVISSFEAITGAGSAAVYTRLASKAMSKHFRSLKDGIVGQIRAVKKTMGDKDTAAQGTSRGETPRLKVLDQSLRQQRAFQQLGMESHPWRPQRGLPERSVTILRAWLFEHFLHPYPSDVDKHILARQTGLSRSQVSNWFINARVRIWKPMVEEMYVAEEKDEAADNMSAENGRQDSTQNPNPSIDDSDLQLEDQKPSLDELLPQHDSDSLSSIFNNRERRNEGAIPIEGEYQIMKQHGQDFITQEAFGVVQNLDFSSYSNQTRGVSYTSSDRGGGHSRFGGSNGVSLTLGLQQHGGDQIGLPFSPAGSQHTIVFTRSQHDDDQCQPIQYSILEGPETQSLPYRSFMGAQLLHDLAG